MRKLKSRFYSNLPKIIHTLLLGLLAFFFCGLVSQISMLSSEHMSINKKMCPPETFIDVEEEECTLDLGRVKTYNTLHCKCPNKKKCFDVVMKSGKIHFLLHNQKGDFRKKLRACRRISQSNDTQITENK